MYLWICKYFRAVAVHFSRSIYTHASWPRDTNLLPPQLDDQPHALTQCLYVHRIWFAKKGALLQKSTRGICLACARSVGVYLFSILWQEAYEHGTRQHHPSSQYDNYYQYYWQQIKCRTDGLIQKMALTVCYFYLKGVTWFIKIVYSPFNDKN